ncbi:MAG: DUF6268 family outer membrane beta-barrel protein [Exilibacterium sp.]
MTINVVRHFLLVTTLLMFCVSLTAAGGTVCVPPPAGDWLTLGWGRSLRADLDEVAGTVTVPESAIGLAAGSESGFAWGLQHHYRSFEVEQADAPSLDSNGDLHQLGLPLQWQGGDWRFAAAPGLSVSSNALRHPGRIDRDSWQLWTAAVYSRAGWRLGLCADNRFGHFRAYPTLGYEWETEGAWLLRLVFPDPLIRYRYNQAWNLELFARPYGGDWRVFDEDLRRRSRWRYQSWRGGLRLRWRRGDWGLDLALGRESGREISALRRDGIKVSFEPASATFVAFELQWRFGLN